MKLPRLLLVIGVSILAGCATLPGPANPDPADERTAPWIRPEQAVILAAESAPRGVRGTFAMRVRATGADRDEIYLNSELDYRDQRNLTVVLGPRAAGQLRERLAADPRVALKGRDILVNGRAMRTKIHFFADGRPTDKYYYQTHVYVTEADRIVIE